MHVLNIPRDPRACKLPVEVRIITPAVNKLVVTTQNRFALVTDASTALATRTKTANTTGKIECCSGGGCHGKIVSLRHKE
jgi:hypothetical protein